MTSKYTRSMFTLERGTPILLPAPGKKNLTLRKALHLLGVIIAGRKPESEGSMSATLLCKDGQITLDIPCPKDRPVDDMLEWLEDQVLLLKAQRELEQ